MTDRHWVYELYGEDDALLYVGYTSKLGTRLSTHAAQKSWWPEVARVAVASFATEDEARAQEREQIIRCQPRCNVQYLRGDPATKKLRKALPEGPPSRVGRPRLRAWTHGEILIEPQPSTRKGYPRFKAKARYRTDTELRVIARFGTSPADAEANLRAALAAVLEPAAASA